MNAAPTSTRSPKVSRHVRVRRPRASVASLLAEARRRGLPLAQGVETETPTDTPTDTPKGPTS